MSTVFTNWNFAELLVAELLSKFGMTGYMHWKCDVNIARQTPIKVQESSPY